MAVFNSILSKEQDFIRLQKAITAGDLPVACSGLAAVHKALFIANIKTAKKLVITDSEASANALYEDLRSLSVKALLLPSRDYNLAHITGYSKEYEHKRINTLSRLLGGESCVLIASIDAAMQYTLPPELLEEYALRLKPGDSLNISDFCEKLTECGYVRCETVEGVGQFAVRGDIIDVFSPSEKSPYRIELWGDEIDNLSPFDIETQRREDPLDQIDIFPAEELMHDNKALCEKLSRYLSSKHKFTDDQRKYIERDIEDMNNGLFVPADLYIPFLYDRPATVFDYMNGATVFLLESANIKDRIKNILLLEAEDVKIKLESGELSEKTAKLRLSKGEFQKLCGDPVYLENFPRASYSVPLKELISFDFKRNSPWSGDMTVLCEDLSHTLALGGTAVILAGEEKAAKVLCGELNDKKINAAIIDDLENIPEGKGVFVATGGLSSGFEIPSLNFSLITHRFVSGEGKIKRRKIKNAKEIGSLDELQAGDYVVHASHGIGIFAGINRIKNGKITKDYIKITYTGSDVLYVPVTQLDLVSKYIGAAEKENLRLNKLGSSEWQKTRSRVRAAVKNMAKELTALYAKRMAAKGYAFSPDTDLQNDFERRFEYEETEDQLRCINEIKGDMERAVPMDRLLCGDVGFGKTEVALRAAFKCVSEGKQCVLLCPTTILAAQHFQTVKRRFGELPIEVKLLSRFVPKKEQTKTIAGLKSGRVDMVIGTHRIISKDITFKNPGLVIIDEEQRFGVAQKERLKELYPFVDILTLSATPIPRTLNMAMSGLRDMSSIDEAPGDRHPVQTYVLEQNNGVLTDAILKEMRRGGQVYYLHNRVDSIVRCAAKLKERLPGARIGIAHGKMSEDELNEVWSRLLEHEIDVLVCTTIIETGVDVPNCNTLIIEDADRMGLSQLHQLRGRVGRSPRRAYAYFCYNSGKGLSEISSKRLEAIRQFTEFGSGFKIALRDLEIRGAGSILGGEQHGNMEAVGYDMYLKLLSEAVGEESGEEVKPQNECTVDLNISAHIPESYIESLPARLGIYKRIADIRTPEDAADVQDELCDRFGDPPKVVLGLMDIALLRARAQDNGISEITGSEKAVVLHTNEINGETAAALAAGFGDRFVISAASTPLYTIKLKSGENQTDIVSKLSKILPLKT